jgi:hypothetical protein
MWLLDQLILQRVAEQRLRSREGGCWQTAGAQFRQWRLPRHLNKKVSPSLRKNTLFLQKNCKLRKFRFSWEVKTNKILF